MKLEPCPCGKVPSKLLLESLCARGAEDGIGDRLFIYGDCCMKWIVWIDTDDYTDENADMVHAMAWNASPRGKE